MKLKFRHIKSLLASVFVLLMAASCSPDSPATSEEGIKYEMRFRLTTDGIFSATRATWGDAEYDKDDGNAFDQTITSVDLYMVNADGSLWPLYALELPAVGGRTYVCEVDKSTPGVTIDEDSGSMIWNGRIMAVANVEHIDNHFTNVAELMESRLPYRIEWGQSTGWHIPMWGVETFKDVVLTPNKTTDLGSIWLLRAAAKIDIRLHESVADYLEIESVEIHNKSADINSEGYTLPAYAESVNSTKNVDIGKWLSVKEDGAAFAETPFRNTGVGSWVAYIGESSTTSGNPYAFDVTLRYKEDPDKSKFTGVLYFATYSKTNPVEVNQPITDVLRNYEYRFTLKFMDMKFQPIVEQWIYGGKEHLELE